MNEIESRQLAASVIDWGLSKKAEDVVLLDVRGLSDVTDYFVLMTGGSQIHVHAITDVILDGAAGTRNKPLHVEGRDLGRWVLIDFVDVVVHVMQEDARRFYALERLWGDATLTRFDPSGEEISE